MQSQRASRIFFAATMIAIGLIGLIGGAIGPIWQPVPETMPGRAFLACLCGLVGLVCGAGLLSKRTATLSALVLFLYLLVWAILFKGPLILKAPLVEGSYQSIGENAVQIAGAWILYVLFANETNKAKLGFLAGETGLTLARILYGLALIAFGFSHFAYLELTTPLVPTWLPGPPIFWAYLTGAGYLAAGIAVITGFAARLGALGAAVQIALITLLVWGPFIIVGNTDAGHWQETIVSWAIMAGAWVVAASYEGQPWLGLSGSRPATEAPRVPSHSRR